MAYYADDRFAAYLENEALGEVLQASMNQQAQTLLNKRIVPKDSILGARLSTFEWANQNASTAISDPNPGSNKIAVFLDTTATIAVEVFQADAPANVLSTIRFSLSEIRIPIAYQNNKILLSQPEYSIKVDEFKRANPGNNDIELARMEGVIGYSVVPKAIANILSQPVAYDLSILFPSIHFGSNAKLFAVNKGKAVGIVTEFRMNEGHLPCLCDGPDIGLKPPPVFQDDSQGKGEGDTIGAGGLSTPIPERKDPHKDFGLRPNGSGVAGLYISRKTASAITRIDRAAKDINLSVSDNGFIGFTADATVSFGEASLSFDTAGGGIFVDQDIAVTVKVAVTQDLCFARIPIGGGLAFCSPLHPNPNVRLGFYPAVDQQGTVKLRGTLVSIDDLNLTLVAGTIYDLMDFGIGFLAEFIGKNVLNNILADKLGSAIRNKLKEQISSSQWDLVDGVPVVVRNDVRRIFSAPYDVGPNSLLISFDYRNADR
ncbi:hypothetical protein CO666_22345 [Rhizobium chutanense]|uniref:Uncharacterized protein n=1 Tax=Rhizobium chutanense TaxID=2035448 RepID=A0A2A6J7Z2_9HYPH|nr:hypothetical protein CO666_22345 [Rhizobium chutanense]